MGRCNIFMQLFNNFAKPINLLNMNNLKKITAAFISVYDKTGIAEIAKELDKKSVKIISTGGTADHIEQSGIKVIRAESITGYPSILGGRVKTLHPKIFGGILSRSKIESDGIELAKYEIPKIDLVIVDLYPFEQTLISGCTENEIIEKIDIGGISLIRAAAKNFEDTLIISNSAQYPALEKIIRDQKCGTTVEERKRFAAEAFSVSSHYDTAIFNYFNTGVNLPVYKASYNKGGKLRYGENPHQKAWFFGDRNEIFDQLHGKEISYNNLLDIDAAVALIGEFKKKTFAVIKHNNACGVASRDNLAEAWKDALAGDPVSAFGGILVTNSTVDKKTADEINKLFFEIIIAPGYEQSALDILKEKKNRIILLKKELELPLKQARSVLNGIVLQERDRKTETSDNMMVVTDQPPSGRELKDLEFANIIVKHTKSNAIVLAKNEQLVGSGTGQTSRVDALKQAIAKAESFDLDLKEAVMASDAFFPFADSIEIAGNAGITSIVQPGGSVRDKDSIDYCNQNSMKMVFTGVRHFKH